MFRLYDQVFLDHEEDGSQLLNYESLSLNNKIEDCHIPPLNLGKDLQEEFTKQDENLFESAYTFGRKIIRHGYTTNKK
jgi:hypothetical protein